jgi:hypothetical protein
MHDFNHDNMLDGQELLTAFSHAPIKHANEGEDNNKDLDYYIS